MRICVFILLSIFVTVAVVVVFTGWLIGILIAVYYNPQKTWVGFHPIYNPNEPGALFSLLNCMVVSAYHRKRIPPEQSWSAPIANHQAKLGNFYGRWYPGLVVLGLDSVRFFFRCPKFWGDFRWILVLLVVLVVGFVFFWGGDVIFNLFGVVDWFVACCFVFFQLGFFCQGVCQPDLVSCDVFPPQTPHLQNR